MAKALRLVIIFLLALSVVLPLIWVVLGALQASSSLAGWMSLSRSPALFKSLGLSVWTGVTSTLLSYWFSKWLISSFFVGRGFQTSLHKLNMRLAPMLAIPHAAFAIGLVFLLSPSGWLIRLASPWLTGFEYPPALETTQDPYGIGLIFALVVKETPFLLWNAVTQLGRDDVQKRLQREFALAQTLEYKPTQAFRKVVWPQLANRMLWPLLAVFAYGLTVVDMAIIIGPARPPTLAVLSWQLLQDIDKNSNDQGATAALLLALHLLFFVGAMAVWKKFDVFKNTRIDGYRGRVNQSSFPTGSSKAFAGRLITNTLVLLYGTVMLLLAISSISGVWSFPSMLPQSYTLAAWSSVWQSSTVIWTTLSLALASSALVMLWSVTWLELAPASWDVALRKLLYLPLLMPSVLWVIGLHNISLTLGVDATWLGLLLAHSLAVLPFVIITLSPAYLDFDVRYALLSRSLGRSNGYFLIRVKWPLLRASLVSGFAVGFAVSVAQYLPTLYIGAGRFATVTTEAVTLGSGGQRSLTAAYAWLQFLLPVLCFAIAAWIGRSRKFRMTST